MIFINNTKSFYVITVCPSNLYTKIVSLPNSIKLKVLLTNVIRLKLKKTKNASGNLNDEGGAWARSLFNVIDDLVWNDLHNDFVFAVAICRDGICDVLKTIDQFKNYTNTAQGLAHSTIVQKTFDILETGGARYIRKWATSDMVVRSISYDMAS